MKSFDSRLKEPFGNKPRGGRRPFAEGTNGRNGAMESVFMGPSDATDICSIVSVVDADRLSRTHACKGIIVVAAMVNAVSYLAGGVYN